MQKLYFIILQFDNIYKKIIIDIYLLLSIFIYKYIKTSIYNIFIKYVFS